MPITVTPTAIPDILIIEPKLFSDDRGWFFESFQEKDFSAAIGREINFVQDNHSSSIKGVLRGLHYQLEEPQGKLVRVCCGVVFSVSVDLRKSSKTFGHWVGREISAENKKQIWIPAGFAHGFLVLSDRAEFLYKTTHYWDAPSEQCLIWNDPALKISWPDVGLDPILNTKDLCGLSWLDCKKFD